MIAPWYPTIGSVMPSWRANPRALVVIRPVTIETETPLAIARPDRARPSDRGSSRLSSTSVPSRSRAISRIGKRAGRAAGNGDAGADAHRSTPERARQAAEVRFDRRRPAGQHRRGSRRRVVALVPADLEQRDAVVGEGVRQPGEQPRTTSSPSGPPSSAARGSNDAAIGSPAMASERTYGRFAATTSKRRSSGRDGGSRSATSKRTVSATACADRVLAGEVERVRPEVRGQDHGRPRRAPRDASAARRRRRSRRRRCRFRRRPGGPARRRARLPPVSRAIVSTMHRFDQPLGLRPRDQRPRVDREGDPEELLDAADVGDGLAGQAPRHAVLEPRRRLRSDRRLGMGQDRRSGRPRRRRQGAPRRRAGRTRSRRRGAARSRSRAARRTWPRGRSEPDRDRHVADLAEDLGARSCRASDGTAGRPTRRPRAGSSP